MKDDTIDSTQLCDSNKKIDILLEEYKLGITTMCMFHQDSTKIRIYLITLTSAILGLTLGLLKLDPPPEVLIFSFSLPIVILSSILSIILIISGFLMDFWNRIWLYLYDKRVLEIEKIFHQTPGLGNDVGCLQSSHYKPDFQENSRIERIPKFVIKLLAVYGSVFIYAIFFIFSVVILIIGLTQIGRS